jgi:hypothetical protein
VLTADASHAEVDAEERLEALDESFFLYPENLTTLLYLYVTQHRDEVGAPENF